MNTQTKHEHIIRERFTQRMREWFPGEADDTIEPAVDELMTDLGYVIKKPSVRKSDPELYRVTQREYMRAYQRRRRAKVKESAQV